MKAPNVFHLYNLMQLIKMEITVIQIYSDSHNIILILLKNDICSWKFEPILPPVVALNHIHYAGVVNVSAQSTFQPLGPSE